ncbi:DsbA family protein [Patescibacteria group bacterium]
MDKQNNLTIPVAIIIAGALIAAGVFFSNQESGGSSGPTGQKNNEQQVKEISLAPITSEDHILGNPEAEIKIVEFSDIECPYCKRFHATMNQVIEEYGKDGKVAWVYRHFPLDQLHSNARKEAEATECAAELGGNTGFWDYTNKLYETTSSNDGLDLTKLPDLAEEVGLDRTAFEECLRSERHAYTVESQYQDGVTAGVRGTPHNIIVLNNGDKVALSGAIPYEFMEIVIGMALNNTGAEVINGFVELVKSGAPSEVIEEFLLENYPAGVVE